MTGIWAHQDEVGPKPEKELTGGNNGAVSPGASGATPSRGRPGGPGRVGRKGKGLPGAGKGVWASIRVGGKLVERDGARRRLEPGGEGLGGNLRVGNGLSRSFLFGEESGGRAKQV